MLSSSFVGPWPKQMLTQVRWKSAVLETYKQCKAARRTVVLESESLTAHGSESVVATFRRVNTPVMDGPETGFRVPGNGPAPGFQIPPPPPPRPALPLPSLPDRICVFAERKCVDHKRHEFIAAWDHADNEEGYNRDKAG